MDDSYIIIKNKWVANIVLQILTEEYEKIGIVLNKKKTHIIKLSKGFSFLKTRYILTESGKVIRKPDKRAITRERRKLKKHYKMFLCGTLTLEQISQSYVSWRGAMLKRDSYRSVHNMDVLFYSLFHAAPWKSKKNKKSKSKKKWSKLSWTKEPTIFRAKSGRSKCCSPALTTSA